MNTLTRMDRMVIAIIATVSISLTSILGMSFLIEPAFEPGNPDACERAVKSGFSENICSHREFANSAWGDSMAYFSMAVGEKSYAPYSLRPFIPSAVGALAKFTLSEEQKNDKDRLFRHVSNLMVLLNLLTGISLILLPILYFRKLLLYDQSDMALIVLTGVINLGVIQTAPFFMLDLASYLVFMLAAAAFFSRNILLLSLVACVGILIKEISIVLTLPILVLALESKPRQFLNALYIFLPLFVFSGLRLLMGEDPMSMNYGWNITAGEIKLGYLIFHLGGIDNFFIFAIKVMAGIGGILSLAIYFYKTYRLEKKIFLTIGALVLAVVAANALLASRVPRVVGVVTPFLLFYVLYVIEQRMSLQRNHPEEL